MSRSTADHRLLGSRRLRGSVGDADQITRVIMASMYAVVGFEDAGASSPDWESEHEAPTVDAAIEIAQTWIVSHPAGRVDVIEMVGREGSVVRVVSRRGVESVAKVPPSRRTRWRAWSGRPPQVFLIGLTFTICGAWMFLAPGEIDRYSPQVTRGVGLVCVLLFGGGTAVELIRWVKGRQPRASRGHGRVG